jgi:hypothetical protein
VRRDNGRFQFAGRIKAWSEGGSRRPSFSPATRRLPTWSAGPQSGGNASLLAPQPRGLVLQTACGTLAG